MDYYKYLKYKKKYIDLKNQIGGFSNVNLLGINTINHDIIIPYNMSHMNKLDSYIMAGNIHKQVRKEIRHMIQPGVRIYDIFTSIKDNIRKYTHNSSINGGISFPPCISLSNIIAHHSPFIHETSVIKYSDNVKIDIGVHVNGWIVDSAFTCYFDKKYDILHNATLEALNAGIKAIGLDANIEDITYDIQEIISSYEMNYNGTIYPLKIIKDLSGHSIEQYNVHGNIRIPNYNMHINNIRLKEGTYAIEPLVGIISDTFIQGNITNSYNAKPNTHLYNKFKNMNFSIEDIDNKDNINDLDTEINYDFKSKDENDMSAHYEHSIYISEKKIILTQDQDY
jgi:methionine aminopeptidase